MFWQSQNKKGNLFPPTTQIFSILLDFLVFFAIYYYVMSNFDKLWQVKKELKL